MRKILAALIIAAFGLGMARAQEAQPQQKTQPLRKTQLLQEAQPLPETFQQYKDGFVPRSVADLWKGYDPKKEPLDIEVLDQWTEADGVICKVIRYRVGVFKGKKAMMAALYAYPANKTNLPGLVQVHGGGQNANLNAVITNARRGYACISVNWAGNTMRGLKNGKDWAWNGISTDWGAVDATQTTHDDHFYSLMPDQKTIDPVYSPRNSNWFLVMLSVRRAITFLQAQAEVNPAAIGIYGHSMGGRLTFCVAAIDRRIKVAVPSSAGQLGLDNDQESDLFWQTAAAKGYAPYQTCPIMFLNPANDFYGRIEDIEETIDAIPTQNFALSRDAQLNHRTQPDHAVCGLLWLDQYLRGNFTFPKNPQIDFSTDSLDHIPVVRIKPEINSNFVAVDVYYSRGQEATGRYWEWARAEKKGNVWIAKCPILSGNDTFRAFANVSYSLDHPVTGASFYYEIYTAHTFTISSRMITVKPGLLRIEDVKATDSASSMIESFDENWQKRWYEFNTDNQWPYRSHKLNDKKWQAPSANARLSFEVKNKSATAIQIELDEYAAIVELKQSDLWQKIQLAPADFKLKATPSNAGKPKTLASWTYFKELAIGPAGVPPKKEEVPVFRNLKWD